MTINEIVYSAHQHLKLRTGAPIRRAQVYELLAALFGYKSHIALLADAVITQRRDPTKYYESQVYSVRNRCTQLGFEEKVADVLAVELGAYAARSGLETTMYSDLVRFASDYPVDLDALPPLALDGLKDAAGRGISTAHYALALYYKNEAEWSGSDAPGGNGSHWYFERRRGAQLSPVQSEWADGYARILELTNSYERHLREAALRGSWHALLDLAEKHGDASIFNYKVDASVVDQPLRIAEVAVQLGRESDAHHWYTVAARSGNTEAMRELIEKYDAADVKQCWIWAHLAALLGVDLFASDYVAINEDGTEYDDDIGGPVYADGRDGIELTPLGQGDDQSARQAAKLLYENIQSQAPKAAVEVDD